MPEDTPRTLKTVEITSRVVRALVDLDGATVTELATHLELSKGCVYNHLATLKSQKLVHQKNGEYGLGYRFFQLGQYKLHSSVLYNAAKPEIDRLVEETGETGNIMVEEFGAGVYLYKKKKKEGIADEYHANLLKESDYLHHSATGKTILAQLSEKRRTEIIDEYGLPASTEHTITREKVLSDELATIRNRGYALNDEEQVNGTRAIGATVTDPENKLLGSISISGPKSRIDDIKFYEQFPDLVLEASNVIEVSLETQKSPPVQF